MTISNPPVWYILMSNVATVCNGAGDLKKWNISHSNQMNDGLSRRSEQTSSAYKNARFVPNDKDFYLFFCDKMPLK